MAKKRLTGETVEQAVERRTVTLINALDLFSDAIASRVVSLEAMLTSIGVTPNMIERCLESDDAAAELALIKQEIQSGTYQDRQHDTHAESGPCRRCGR